MASKFSISELVTRHRLSLAQIERLGWGKIEKEQLIEEKVRALAELKNIQTALDQLEQSEIFFILFKGIALSQRIYGDPTFRTSRDLDILVLKREDVEILRKHLLSLGWEDSEENPWIENTKRRGWYMDYIHHHMMWNPCLSLLMEIHWNLDHQFLDLRENELQQLISGNTQSMQVLNREIQVLKPELEFMYLLVHGARDGYYRLKWLVDILHYPFGKVDYSILKQLLEKYNLKALLVQANELLKTYFQQEIPFPIESKAAFSTIKYAQKRIEGELWTESRSFSQIVESERYFFLLSPGISSFFKSMARNGIRHQDFSDVELNARWKYYFYRYISYGKRKVSKTD
ncbi:nucleotidyltransferase family protein [Algoriphagus kandeliae]|uniref:nucleotidyltransferase family protein n=1 Tax=Algoriphagus kandeliae TaxID=2562278 RepID=UPI0013875169|nr:nucleotidyltransferase family protein [Algoriphagus kandeliae]